MELKIGEVIKSIRLKKGFKAKFVAEKLEVDPSTLSKYESDERQIPAKLLPVLAELYSCEVNDFFDKNVGDTPIKNHSA